MRSEKKKKKKLTSAIPPTTTRRDDPSDERPAVSPNGTVNPSLKPMILIRTEWNYLVSSWPLDFFWFLIFGGNKEERKETYTSLTMSGLMRWRSSSPLNSLQQIGISWGRLFLSHLFNWGVKLVELSLVLEVEEREWRELDGLRWLSDCGSSEACKVGWSEW